MLTLAGQNSVTESHAPDADITLCGMEVWGNLTLRGTGTLTATCSQCGSGENAGGDPAVRQSGAEPTTDPAMKPAATSPKTATMSKTTLSKTTVATSSNPKTATANTAALPKTNDSKWIVAYFTFFLLGAALLTTSYRC